MRSYAESRQAFDPSTDWRIMVLTLVAAFVLKQLPWQGIGLMVRPDFVLVVLLFWAQRRRQGLGLGLAFLLGIFADVQDGAVLGQHSLAYCVGIFLILFFKRRLAMFTLPQQALQIFPLLLLAEVIALMAGWMTTRTPQGGWVFTSAFTGTLLWWVMAVVWKMPAARTREE